MARVNERTLTQTWTLEGQMVSRVDDFDVITSLATMDECLVIATNIRVMVRGDVDAFCLSHFIGAV
jgi:hypothetical protein